MVVCRSGRALTLAKSLTPCRLTPWMQRDFCSSFMVMGFEGSRRPWSIHDWMRSRLMGDISTWKLCAYQPCCSATLLLAVCHSLIVLPPPSRRVGDGLRCLSTFKARGHLSVGVLTLLTSSSRLALARCRTATAADLLVVGALVIRQRCEDGRAPLLRER
jgi:hypothetical protein